MFEELMKVLDEIKGKADKDADVSFVPAEVILKLDENGKTTISVNGRNKEIFNLVGDMLAEITNGNEEHLKFALSEISTWVLAHTLVKSLKGKTDGK